MIGELAALFSNLLIFQTQRIKFWATNLTRYSWTVQYLSLGILGVSSPQSYAIFNHALTLNASWKLNQKALYLSWLPIRHLSNIPKKRLWVLNWNFWGCYYYYFGSYNLSKSKELKCIQVVQDHRNNFGSGIKLHFQVNLRRYKNKLNHIVCVKIFNRMYIFRMFLFLGCIYFC